MTATSKKETMKHFFQGNGFSECFLAEGKANYKTFAVQKRNVKIKQMLSYTDGKSHFIIHY